jgi:hypothetical protein
MRRLFLLAFTLFAMMVTSCVVTEVPDVDSTTETWCYYNRYGTQICRTCTGEGCSCPVGQADMCRYGVWESVCRACYEGYYYQDLYLDSRFAGCSPHYLCNLCANGGDFCGSYLRSGWDPYPYYIYPPPAYGPGRGYPGRGNPGPSGNPGNYGSPSQPSVPPNAEPSSSDMNQKVRDGFRNKKVRL